MNHFEQDSLFSLLEKFRQYKATPTDCQEMLDFLASHPSGDTIQIINDFFQESPVFSIGTTPFHYPKWQFTLEQILTVDKIPEFNLPSVTAPVHRIHFLKTAWFRYAAAIIIVFGIGTYLWNTKQNILPSVAKTDQTTPLNTDIAPGGNKAVLTLADGTTILLDSAANGAIAQQGNSSILKLASGQIGYRTKGAATGEMLMNTMSTPPGGQYQVTLPDGTKAWLNASSSIKFPTAFTGSERHVEVTGEVYLEVAKNPRQPFIALANGTEVKVLGTIFNINAYKEEGSIKTTLLEGSVRVMMAGQTAILKPGQQAVVTSSDRQLLHSVNDIKVVSDPDIEQTLAWKNGLFNFNGADLSAVMRQLERWYDIKVKYEGSVSNIIFKGEMYRNVNLSDVLEVLQKMGVKFEVEGKTLIVKG